MPIKTSRLFPRKTVFGPKKLREKAQKVVMSIFKQFLEIFRVYFRV